MRLLSILFISICFPFFLLAQVPQAITYQAVAADLGGNELVDQSINVKATVISAGLEIWIETHSVTTDEFGLFVMNIGQGTRIGGIQNNFDDIEWFTDDHFLKIDMDPTGGNTFEFVGTTQMMSVPYAFQSGRAQLADSAGVAGFAHVAAIAQNDDDTDPTNEIQDVSYDPGTGTFSISGGNSITLDVSDGDADPLNEIQTLSFDGVNISLLDANGVPTSTVDLSAFAFTSPGSSFDFPQGIIGEPVLWQSGSNTVPAGKVFYITAADREIDLVGFGTSGTSMHSTTPNMPVLPAGTSVMDCFCTGMMMDVSTEVEARIHDFNANTMLTVPNNKILFVKSGLSYDNPAVLEVNNILMNFTRPNDTRGTKIITFPPSTIIRKPISIPEMTLTYYLIDTL